ncbi:MULTISPECIES: hypothetical protein [Alteromonadaceae]|uniref:hypothetical protein n=1 Tax=Alteromonadaceae TaxID=72275 RepID=UPI001C08D50B|nr:MULTISPECIES: hypothetical protein [Aliiglaciecola]MBU2879507.1 hypothetical protein [Aliiglaciecola lipolytica]MDO6712572.1 hypothetical protein [Aliiglaciecola sp. 2_MG-2023]MDO6753684.1 hypothetical protein [Aliiglaciecola sp. 1_MG-2023]
MANNKSDNKTVVDETPNISSETPSELATLRQIVFGAAQADIEHRLSDLESRMLERFQQAEQKLAEHVKDLNKSMHNGFEDLQLKVNSVDKVYEDKTSELNAYADKLSSELEMSDTNGRQETDELHTRVDKEVAMLTEKYDARFAEALERLDQVTKELSSTKTDRKTLAKLLATMAVNLESDED